MMTGFEKHFRINSSDVKTWRFSDDKLLLSNANYANYNKLVNVIYNVHYLVIKFYISQQWNSKSKKRFSMHSKLGIEAEFFWWFEPENRGE